MMATSLREQVAGLARMGPVELRGETYTGEYLAMLVAINPELPIAESSRTPEIVFQLGRLVAAAAYEVEMAELAYRTWRDGVILQLVTNLELVQKHVDANATKPLAKTTAESAVRTFPEYRELSVRKAKAGEAHGTLTAAYEAARIRQRAIYSYENTTYGGPTRTPDTDGPGVQAVPLHDEGASHEYDVPRYPSAQRPSDQETRAAEERIDQVPRTPIPPAPANMGPPPSPAKPKKKTPPPPPPPPVR